MINNVKSILEKLKKEEEERRFFEKISYKQFKKDIENMFEKKYSEKEIKALYEKIQVPKRGSQSSAGYDFYSPMEFELKPGEVKIIPTGIKASMNKDEVLLMFVRSSVGFKYNVRLTNQTGVIDSDYYNNSSNEGHIMVSMHNHGTRIWEVKYENKNIRIAQGMFSKYLTTKDDNVKDKRSGGIGSTNK